MISSVIPWRGGRVGKKFRIGRRPLALVGVRYDGVKIWRQLIVNSSIDGVLRQGLPSTVMFRLTALGSIVDLSPTSGGW
jgi:hypothetical protein